jgi:hypothetical protein
MLAIVGEPTSMQIANAQKGCSFFRTRVSGREGHSSAPGHGVNAILAAAEIIAEIARIGAEARARARPESGFDPPHTTLSVGTIAGGTAVNIIARDCAFDWDMRNVPEDDAAALKARIDAFIAGDLLPRMRAVYPEAGVATETIVDVPPLVPEPGSPAEALARRLTGANTTTTVSFARGRALSAGRDPGDRMRPGLDRCRPQTRRIHHARGTRRRPDLSRPAAALGQERRLGRERIRSPGRSPCRKLRSEWKAAHHQLRADDVYAP